MAEGRTIAAEVVDHVVPHKGDEWRFLMGELQSLCTMHHNSGKSKEEQRGYSTQVGLDGYPLDKDHPWYRTRFSRAPLTRRKAAE
jgi:hypothetical protein